MDHAYIREHTIVERYEMGKLSSAESALFEEHFVDCPECQGQLQAAQDFRQGLQAAHAKGQLLTEFNPPARTGIFVRQRAFLAVAACAALLFLSVIFLAQQTRRLNREVSRASEDAGTWRQRYEAQRQANTQSQQPSPSLPVVATIFPLNMTRGGEPGNAEPANRITLSGSPQLVVLSLDLDGNDFETFRATLKESSGQVVWKGEFLAPARSHTLSVALPSSLFHQDDYSLTLEGRTRQGNYKAAGQYSFRVKK